MKETGIRSFIATGMIAGIVAAGTLPVCAADAASAKPLAIEDFRATVSFSDPHFGNCGKNVAFVARTADFASNMMRSTIRVVDLQTGVTTVVTRPSDGASSPRWSPDGTKLAFLAKPVKTDAKADPKADDATDAKPQIAVVSRTSMIPVFVTHEARGVDAFAWRRDGAGFAFVTADEAPNKKAIDAHDDAFEVSDNQWNFKAAPVPSHLWTIGTTGGVAHRVTSGPFSLEGDPQFTADDRAVLLNRYPTAFTQHYDRARLVRIDLQTGAIATVVDGAPAQGRFSRDGKRLAYLSQNPRSFAIDDVFSGGADGRGAVDVTQGLDRAAQDVVFGADDRSLVALVHDGTRARLYRVAADGAKTAPIELGERNVSAFDVDCNGRIAFIATTPNASGELYLRGPDGATRRLTHDNVALSRHPLPHMQTVTWTARDGATADGVVYSPVGVAAGTRAPLVLVIHGGPTATSFATFSELPELLAARGYFVFEPNYRGSDNLGAAFAQATVPHITSMPGNDIEDGLAVVLKAFPIDPARIGVSGWSEGGLLTSWLITHDTRWKAAMSGAAVNDWLMYRDLTDSQDFTPNFISATSPWTDDKIRALYAAESPLTYAAAVRTPTLIMTDAGDQRVPTPLAYAFYHAIRATGTPVTMVVIPVDGHFPNDPVHSEDVLRRWVGWFTDKL